MPPTAEQTLLRMPTSLDPSGHRITKNIQDMQVGDRVLTRNQNDPNAPIEQRQVTAVSVHTVDHLRLLDIQEADSPGRDPPHHR